MHTGRTHTSCLHDGLKPKTTIGIKTQLPLINTDAGRLKQFVPKMTTIMLLITSVGGTNT